ncbi:MAG TPA: hypothetical protein VFS01_07530 [Rhizomicrobium sp.]|nr:hypothetical protein [Rhizomicrobium sp.]
MKLRDIAHTRSGDKGDISNISVIAHRLQDFALLRQAVTPRAVATCLEGIVRGHVIRHEFPALGALNFVIYGALGGGVTRSLALDAHGKCLAAVLLNMDIPGPSRRG